MSWEKQIKHAVQRSGVCRTCGQKVRQYEVCPSKLPSKEQVPQGPNCPMK